MASRPTERGRWHALSAHGRAEPRDLLNHRAARTRPQLAAASPPPQPNPVRRRGDLDKVRPAVRNTRPSLADGFAHLGLPVPDFAPTVAVIGGGQLARMLAEPAAALGIPLRLLAEAEGVSAAQVIPDTIVGDYRDLEMLRKVTAGPGRHLRPRARADRAPARARRGGVAVRPGPEALSTPRTRR